MKKKNILTQKKRKKILNIDINSSVYLCENITFDNCRPSIIIGNSYLSSYCFFSGNGIVKIGDRCFFNRNCAFLTHDQEKGGIFIGNNVIVGPNVVFVDNNHDYKNGCQSLKDGYICKPVIIGNNVWIGSGAVILAGTIIKDNSVVAANAVCNKAYDCYSLLGGVPATFIKKIKEI